MLNGPKGPAVGPTKMLMLRAWQAFFLTTVIQLLTLRHCKPGGLVGGRLFAGVPTCPTVEGVGVFLLP